MRLESARLFFSVGSCFAPPSRKDSARIVAQYDDWALQKIATRVDGAHVNVADGWIKALWAELRRRKMIETEADFATRLGIELEHGRLARLLTKSDRLRQKALLHHLASFSEQNLSPELNQSLLQLVDDDDRDLRLALTSVLCRRAKDGWRADPVWRDLSSDRRLWDGAGMIGCRSITERERLR
jgi:hypothetical protein